MKHYFWPLRHLGPSGYGLILPLLVLFSACQSATPPEAAAAAIPAPSPPDTGLAAGQAIFTRRCAPCHGADGKKGLNGAHDLTRSNLNATGRVYMVTNGLGKMPAFKAQLTAAEIEQVVAYSLTLR
jgi:cytochrome c6